MSSLLGSSDKREDKQEELRKTLLMKLAAQPRAEGQLVRDHRTTYGTRTVQQVIDRLVNDGYAVRTAGPGKEKFQGDQLIQLTPKGKTYNAIR